MNNLADLEFVSTDVNQIEANLITVYESISGRTLAPGDPVRIFLQAVAFIIAHQRILINFAAKQNLLAYATGDFLDHLGALVDTPRLQARPAKVTLRFTLHPQPQPVTIPQGTRVTPNGTLFFAVTEPKLVPPGETTVEALAECLTPGTHGNGWQVGQINRLVDPMPWVQDVENTTVSSGGADVEDDDSYKERIRQAPESFSTAGPIEGYEYWVKTVSADIIDVNVSSPAPVEVEIRPLMTGGELPSQEIIDAIAAVVNDKRIRPLTDKVTVLAPDVVSYDVDITYYIDTKKATEAAEIQARITQAVDSYVLWQKSKLGRDINPSELIRLVMNAGAKRVVVNEPVFTVVPNTSVAVAETVTVNYGGFEDD